MSSYVAINNLSLSLSPLYLLEQDFWSRFTVVSRIEDPFVRVYDICKDTSKENCRVAVKDYNTYSEEQYENVMLNLENYKSIEKIEEIAKLVAFCQEQSTGDIRAAFQYNHNSLEQLINNQFWQQNSYQLYLFLLKEVINVIQSFRNNGIALEQLTPSNILFEKQNQEYKIKILYDERQKKYDKIQQGIKVFCSAEKVNLSLRESSSTLGTSVEQTIFELGLLLLDIIYLYESSSPQRSTKEVQKKGSLTNSTALFKSYLFFDNLQSCRLNDELIEVKLDYLKKLKSIFLNQFVTVIVKMIRDSTSRISLAELKQEAKTLAKFSTKEKHLILEKQFFQLTQKEISPIKSKQSVSKRQDSLKYSQSHHSQKYLKRPLVSQTTVPTLNAFSSSDHKSQSEDYHIEIRSNPLDFFILPKEKLLSVNCHPDIAKKLQIFLIQLQNKMGLTKKDYYDKTVYYGEINQMTQKRTGLGIFVYPVGDIYFGRWGQNSLIEGTYIFKNGQSFQGYVRGGKQGHGKYYYANGNIYEGQWKDDLKHGFGKMFYSNGDSYDGQWLKGKKNGQGTYFYNNGIIYRGSYLHGKKHGEGTIDFSDGTKIEALWLSNHIEGKGKIFYRNGDYFQGIFNTSKKEGQGQYRWHDFTKYEGCFRKDLMQGEAKIHFGQNQYYEGHIVQGRRQGQGYYRYANGDEFKGLWRNDQKYSGQYTYTTGGTFQGRFKHGEMTYGLMIYPHGQSYQGQFLHGERHGQGVYRLAKGNIKFQGQWDRDNYLQ